MKTFVRMAALCAVGASLLTACQKEDKAVNLEKEPQTVIELMEKEEGKTFFKKDLVLKDASGQNEVVMRFASESESELKRYFEIYDFKISPLFKSDAQRKDPSLPQESNSSTSPETGKSHRAAVISEPVRKQLQSDAAGFKLQVLVKPEVSNRSGRIQELDTEAEFVTGVWPELIRLIVLPSGGVNKVDAVVDEKDRWYNSWYTWYDWYRYYSNVQYSAPRPAGQRDFNVDSPWKARIKVKYDPVTVFPTTGTTPGFEVEIYTDL